MPRLTDSSLRRCTVELRSGKFCDAPSAAYAPFPICAQHATALFLEMRSRLTPQKALELLNQQPDTEEVIGAFTQPVPRHDNPVVYYVGVDGLVKIGFTNYLPQRLEAWPPTTKILATEPGDFRLERQRHQEFAEYLIEREWFTYGPRLHAHIAALPTHDWSA